MLTEAGWQVDTAPDGREALGFVDAQRYEVVLSDIDMPGINGVQLLREIRARDLDVPVLLITGHPRVDTAVEALEHGALRYLQKPLRERDLLSAVEDAARLHRMARLKREALAAIGLEDRLPADRAGLETRFGHALASLRLVFQPILRAADGTVFGYEALTRTDEPSIPHPGALFEAAERLGRVHEVGGVVRDRAAAFLGPGARADPVRERPRAGADGRRAPVAGGRALGPRAVGRARADRAELVRARAEPARARLAAPSPRLPPGGGRPRRGLRRAHQLRGAQPARREARHVARARRRQRAGQAAR